YGSVLSGGYAVEHALFPGFVVLAAAVGGSAQRFESRRIAYVVLALLAFDWSLGLIGISYRVLYTALWIYHGLRVPARMYVIVSAALAVLGGYGVQRLLASTADSRRRGVIFAAAIGLLLIENATKPHL